MEKDYYGLPPWYRLNRQQLNDILQGSLDKWKLENYLKGFKIQPVAEGFTKPPAVKRPLILEYLERSNQPRPEDEPPHMMDGLWKIMKAAMDEAAGVKDIPYEVVSSRLLKDEMP